MSVMSFKTHLVSLLGAITGIHLVVLDRKLVVLSLKSLSLLLQGLLVLLFLCEFLLKVSNLVGSVSWAQLLTLSTTGTWLALVLHELLFQAESIEDHDVHSVENEGEEESEAGEVHVSLGVELSGLDFHSVGSQSCSSSTAELVGGGQDIAVRWATYPA